MLPPRFARYLKTVGRKVLGADDLVPYLSIAESTRTTDPTVLEARIALNRLRQATEELRTDGSQLAEVVSNIMGYLRSLIALVGRLPFPTRSGLPQILAQLEALSDELKSADVTSEFAAQWAQKATQTYHTLDSALRELYRLTNIGAYE